MNPKRTPSRRLVISLLLLSGVLVLGIVQWSFLPLLIQNGPVGKTAVVEVSEHSAKFAAPYKGLFCDGLIPCLVHSRVAVRRVASRTVRLPDAPVSDLDDFSLTHRPLRAPPSA